MTTDRYRYFRIEARELADELGNGVRELERAGVSREVVAKILRHAHTLKGAARIVKHRELAELAHALEDVLEPWRDGAEDPARPVSLDAARALIDAMSMHVNALPAAAPTGASVSAMSASMSSSTLASASASAPTAARVAATTAISTATPTPSTTSAAIPTAMPAVVTPRAEAGALDELIGELAEVRTQLARARAVADPRALTDALIEQLPDRRGAVAARLDALGSSFHRALALRLDHVQRELEQARQDAERLRLLPASAVFAALDRTAHDVARAAGLSVELVTAGGEIRVDAQVIAAIQGSLVQLVRNAVAHGIEPAADRVAAGKPASGRVAIDVRLRGHVVVFAVSDDGRGIDLDAVRRAAVQRGTLASDARDPDEVLRVLLRGGISTAAAVTEVAGRGIGLDIVGVAARELGGDISARTTLGAGTTFTLAVPVTLAALSTLVVEAGGRSVAVPIDAVRRAIRVTPDELARTATGWSLAFDDVALPFVPLAHVLGDPGVHETGATTAVVIAAGGELAAIGVDRLRGTEDIVLRAVPAGAPVAAIVWGLSLDADGRPRIVVDPAELVRAARHATPPPTAEARRLAPILVVDDSLTTRMLEQAILESAGYDVEVASSAEDALIKLRDRSYALVLVDVEMPGMDGFGLVAELRARPATATLPAILVTSRDAPEDLRRGVEVGAQGYVIKSEFDQVELLARIARLVAR